MSFPSLSGILSLSLISSMSMSAMRTPRSFGSHVSYFLGIILTGLFAVRAFFCASAPGIARCVSNVWFPSESEVIDMATLAVDGGSVVEPFVCAAIADVVGWKTGDGVLCFRFGRL